MSNPFVVDPKQPQVSRLEFTQARRDPAEAVYQYVGRLKRILDTVPGSNLQDQIFMISSKLPNRIHHRLLQLSFASYEDFLIKVKAIEDEFKLEDEKKAQKKGGGAGGGGGGHQKNFHKNKKDFNKQNADKFKSTPNLNTLGDQLGQLSLSDNISISINLNKTKDVVASGSTESKNENPKKGPHFNNRQQKSVQQNQPNRRNDDTSNNPKGNNNFQRRNNQPQSQQNTTADQQRKQMFNNKKHNPHFNSNTSFNQKNENTGKLYPKLQPQQLGQSFPPQQPPQSFPSQPPHLPSVSPYPSSLPVTLDNRVSATATVDPSTMNSVLSSRLAAQLGLILPGTASSDFYLIDTIMPMRVHTTGDLYCIRLSIDSRSFNELTLGNDFIRCYQS